MKTGRVKFYDINRGFGFVTLDGTREDVFFHLSVLKQSGIETVHKFDRLTFDVEPDRLGKGMRAVNIKLEDAR